MHSLLFFLYIYNHSYVYSMSVHANFLLVHKLVKLIDAFIIFFPLLGTLHGVLRSLTSPVKPPLSILRSQLSW